MIYNLELGFRKSLSYKIRPAIRLCNSQSGNSNEENEGLVPVGKAKGFQKNKINLQW